MIEIVSGKSFKVSYIEEVPCAYIQWFGLPTSDEFRYACDSVIELLGSRNLSKVLTDNTQAKVFSTVDIQWLNDNWLPRAEKAGYRVSATIYSDSETFIKFAVDKIVKKRDSGKFISQHFTSFQEALNWLKTV